MNEALQDELDQMNQNQTQLQRDDTILDLIDEINISPIAKLNQSQLVQYQSEQLIGANVSGAALGGQPQQKSVVGQGQSISLGNSQQQSQHQNHLISQSQIMVIHRFNSQFEGQNVIESLGERQNREGIDEDLMSLENDGFQRKNQNQNSDINLNQLDEMREVKSDNNELPEPIKVIDDDFFISKNSYQSLSDIGNFKKSQNQVKIKKQNFIYDSGMNDNEDLNQSLEEEEEIIPEIIEIEESIHEDQTSQSNQVNNLNQQIMNQFKEEEKDKGYYLLLNDNESDDLEALTSQKRGKDEHMDQIILDKQNILSTQNESDINRYRQLQSSQSTILAHGEHHIKSLSGYSNQFNLNSKIYSGSHYPLPYHSVDGQLMDLNIHDKQSHHKVIQWAAQSMKDNNDQNINFNFQSAHSNNNNNHSSNKNHGLIHIKDSNNQILNLDVDLNDEFEERKELNLSSVIAGMSRKNNESENLILKQQEEQELLLKRGRNSVLEEVEDDDIVNQNSSKSSSKFQSLERLPQQIESRADLANHILQSFSQTSQDNSNWKANIQLMNQRNFVQEEIKQEDQLELSKNQSQRVPSLKNLSKIENSSGQSSRRGRISGKGSNNPGTMKFTYFAASSLSDDRWLCPICLDIFEEAVETPCCHNLFCEECIKKTPTCPLCNLRINGQLKPNIPIRRLVNELSVSCINQYCEDVIRKGEIDKHLKVCQFTPLACPNNEMCGKIMRKELERHKNEECPYRIVECLLKCSLMLPLNDIEDHIAQDCPKYQINCKNACGGIIERGDMEKHINIDCPLQIVDCPNKGDSLFEEGCHVRLKRKEMESHKLTCNFRKVYCPNQKCNAVIIYKDLYSHDERCLYKIIDCDNKCGQKIQRQLTDKHRDTCEFQLVKCPYYDLGCKIEILRKDYIQHLQEESFNHSIIFIEGQKRRNREIDELKYELVNLRQNYDLEIQSMFLDLHRMKDEVTQIKQKTGIHTTNSNNINNNINLNSNSSLGGTIGTKMILGNNAGLGGGLLGFKKDERRFEPALSSAGSGLFEIGRNRNELQFRPNLNNNNERQIAYNNLIERERSMLGQNINVQLRSSNNFSCSYGGNIDLRQNMLPDSNAASLAQSTQSLDNSSNLQGLHSNGVLSSQQLSNINRLQNNQNNNNNLVGGGGGSIFSNNPFFQRSQYNLQDSQSSSNQHINIQYTKPRFDFRSNNQNNHNANTNYNNNNSQSQLTGIDNSNSAIPSNLFGENSQRGRIPMIVPSRPNSNNNNNNNNVNNYYSISNMNNEIDRKNQLATLLLGSMNASQDSSRNTNSNINTQNNNNNNINISNNNQNNNQMTQDQSQINQQLYQSYQNSYLKQNDNFDNQRMSFGNINHYHLQHQQMQGNNKQNNNNTSINDDLSPNVLQLQSRNNQDNQSNIRPLSRGNNQSSNDNQIFPPKRSSRRIGIQGMSELINMNNRNDQQRQALSSINETGDSSNRNKSSRQVVVQQHQDLDSSNVIYDDDFEIEEEKHNY